MTTHTTPAIKRAVTLAGGATKLASACGVSAQAVYKWLKKGHPPTDRCEAVEIAVGGKVSRFDLLPAPFIGVKAKPDRRRKVSAASP
jgi:DNA-binding transcriptional regulator YdaS (Cro superfamily)